MHFSRSIDIDVIDLEYFRIDSRQVRIDAAEVGTDA